MANQMTMDFEFLAVIWLPDINQEFNSIKNTSDLFQQFLPDSSAVLYHHAIGWFISDSHLEQVDHSFFWNFNHSCLIIEKNANKKTNPATYGA